MNVTVILLAGSRDLTEPGVVPGKLDDYCPGAGPRRNAAMVNKQPRPAWMVAFPEPGQRNTGTRGCMKLAAKAGITVHEVTS